jgi:pimeloyl-ACP methyl ester carboxylesterase
VTIDTTTVEVGGVRGVCESAGGGPPLVLLASPLVLARTYRATAARLASRFRVLTLELPGTGRADSVGAGWSSGQYAEWVAGFLGARDLGRPVVVGHSRAGAIGVRLAARHPELIGGLVLADATGAGPHPPVRAFAAGLFDVLLEARVTFPRVHHVAWNALFHTRNFLRQFRDSIVGDERAEIARVGVPALVAWGARDHTFPQRDAAEYARLLPDARLYLSPRGSHDWLLSRPGEFTEVVAAFAAELERRRIAEVKTPGSPAGRGEVSP